jgi:hypothetical protein
LIGRSQNDRRATVKNDGLKDWAPPPSDRMATAITMPDLDDTLDSVHPANRNVFGGVSSSSQKRNPNLDHSLPRPHVVVSNPSLASTSGISELELDSPDPRFSSFGLSPQQMALAQQVPLQETLQQLEEILAELRASSPDRGLTPDPVAT